MNSLKENENQALPEVLRGFETIVQIIEEAKKAMKPGVLGAEIDDMTRLMVTEAGYDEFPRAPGHQVDTFAHDGTALLGPRWEKYADKPFRPLATVMVFTLEPRLAAPGRGLVTI